MDTLKPIPEVTPMSSFHDLTKFLILSFTEKKRKEVEEILVKREKRLIYEFEEIKLHFHKVKELQLSKENSDKEMIKEQHILEYKLSISEMEKSEFQEKNRDLECKNGVLEEKIGDLAYKIEVLEVKNQELQSKVDELGVKNGEFENKIAVFEVKCEDLEYTIEVLERQNEDLQNQLGELEEKNEGLENKVEVLEGTKAGLVEKIEVRNERLEKKWMVVEERLANVKGLFGSVGRGNDSGGGVVTKRDSHDKDSDWTGCHTKSQASFGNPSSKTPPQVESRGTEEITVGAHLGEGARCSENNIKFKRKRSIDGSDDDKDSTEKYEDKNGSHENSEPHFKRSISGSVDGINRSARGDPHVASLKNKVVAGFQSGKKIRWKYLGDMFSAFEEDDELCMASVCALFRQDISGMVSKDGSGFSSIDLVRGSDVAEYLIDGDTENKLRRSAEEVRQNRPDIIDSCKRLAIRNGVQLFKIYQNKLDPFWPNSSILDNWF